MTAKTRSLFLNRYEAELCGPDMLALDVCRALVAATNARRIATAAAEAAIGVGLDKIEAGRLMLHPTPLRRVRLTTDLAIALGHPLADCVYLALALDLGCDLATCDARFRDRAAARYPRVRLLAEFS